jgi:DNA-binding GntR family transcriptional regulator
VSVRAYGNKAERIYDALRAELLNGEWSFGQQFSTYELAQRFGVSRRPIMDAVQRLESDGFVEIIPQVGCRVVAPDATRVRDQLELSAILQGPATHRAALRASDADIQRLSEIHARLVPTVAARDFDAWRVVHREFHSAILETAGNQALADLAEDAMDLWEFYFHPIRQHVIDLAALEERLADDTQILDAIRAHDGDRAQQQMEAHLDPDRLLEVLRRFTPPDEQPLEADNPVAALGAS